MRIAKVAVENATYAIDKVYSYLVPEEMTLSVGCRVLVPFGRGNRTSEGMVLSIEEQAVTEKPLKAISMNVDGESIVSQREIKLALWMSRRYFCTFYDAIGTILPSAVWYRYKEKWSLTGATEPSDGGELSRREKQVLSSLADGVCDTETVEEQWGKGALATLYSLERRGLVQRSTESRRGVQDKTVQLVSPAIAPEEAQLWIRTHRRSAVKMAAVLEFLLRAGQSNSHDVCYYTGATRATLNAMEKRGLVHLCREERYRLTTLQQVTAPPITLNAEQQTVFDTLAHRLTENKPCVTLLQGVTGSGKTLVYIRLVQEVLDRGGSALVLVPEIALTPQMMARFGAYFGDKVALLHSALRLSERYDQWKRIRRGEATVVLGTRSAVFAPLQNLALIIMDEEQESSYESENAPCYHARDIAKYRCSTEGAQLVLGSATPTVETAYFARNGEYHFLEMKSRYNDHALPRVITADLRCEVRGGNSGTISAPLYEELRENIRRGEQSILFLNRRGTSRRLLCPQCGYAPECPRCSVYLTYHRANGRVMCHHCGHSETAPELCPACGTELSHVGFGTQQVAQELEELFPGVPLLRMDADTVGEGHEAILRRFRDEQVPLLLGTQMVAKGLDFENVTLVGVLAADMSLYVDHYRAAERTFSLLTQVVGRAGRGEKEGRAVIQTYTPDNEVICAAAAQDYDRFYEMELKVRRARRDPPFADRFVMTVVGLEESQVLRAAKSLQRGLYAAAQREEYREMHLLIFGPAPAPVVKVNNRYRYRVVVVGRNEAPLRHLLSDFMRRFYTLKENRGLQVYTDCNLMDD